MTARSFNLSDKNLVIMNCRILLEKQWDELEKYDLSLLKTIINSLESTECFSDLVNIYLAVKDEYLRKEKVVSF
jgi:hypothetical protein